MRRSPLFDALLGACALLLVACPKPKPTDKPRAKAARATVEIYTEASAVTAVTPLGGLLYVGTGQGLVAWNLAQSKARVLTVDDGLPGNDVRTLATDGTGTLWVGTTTGVARLRQGRWTQFGDCPLGDNITSMAAAADGETVWVGGPKGLARLRHEKWQMVFKKSGINSLSYLQRWKVLWVGTQRHGALRCKGDDCERYDASQLGADGVSYIAHGRTGILALLTAGGSSQVAYRHGRRWHRYKVKPAVKLGWASFAGGNLFFSAQSRLYKLIPRKEVETPPGPLELAPQTTGAPEFISTTVKRQLPDHVTVVKQALGSLWLGSRRLGVARFNGDLLQYFRTYDLAQNARRLSLACTARTSCYFATGSRLFHKRGQTMKRMLVPDDNDAVFQWVGKDPQGKVLSVYRSGRGSLEVARLKKDGTSWAALELKPALQTRQGPLQASFVRLDPQGRLWVGLAIEDGGDTRGAGLAVIDLGTGQVLIHGRGAGLPITEGALGITSDLSGAAFAKGVTYIGSRSGVIRIARDRSLKVFTENHGLVSELINQVARGSDGRIYVATPSGLGVYDGKMWRFPSGNNPRTTQMDTVVRAPDGALWFGGKTGLHRLKNGRLTSFDEVDGLLANGVKSIAVDPYKRIWVLHKRGLSIVQPKQ